MMKRFVSLIFSVLMILSCAFSVLAADEKETLPIPERPENLYIIDESGLLDKRTIDAVLEKGDAMFAVTGAQVVFIVVAGEDKTDLGELAAQTLDVWQLGSYERDNGIVVTMNFERGRLSYAIGEGISQLYNDATMQTLLTSHHIGDYFAEEQYDRAVLAMYNDIYRNIQEYYEIQASFWDGTTYLYEAKYEHEIDYKPYIIGGAAVVVLLVVVVILICHGAKHKDEDDFEEEASDDAATEEYNTDEGDYNKDEGEYNTDPDAESYSEAEGGVNNDEH